MKSDHYVSKRTLAKVDKVTSSMMENGLHKFYTSFTAFKRQLFEWSKFSTEDDLEHALTMEQLWRPMILIFWLWGMALVAWIAEILIRRWKNWWDRILA